MATPLAVSFTDDQAFLAAFDSEISKRGLLARGASAEGVQAMAECTLRVTVGTRSAEVMGRIAAVVPGVGVAVMFEAVPEALAALAQRIREGAPEPKNAGEEAELPGPLSERLKALTVPQKMALALSGNREERFALIRDPNKMLHVFVLKNPRIGVDEVAYAAKMPTLSPEALKQISEHREWTGNSNVCVALVRNPKTPMPIAIRFLDRIPLSEVRVIAKGGAREQLVHAARKKVNGP